MSNKPIDREAWARFDIFEQMGNISSEVGRSIAAERRGNIKRRDAAIERALDLFDATQEQLVRERSPRLREVLYARNEYLRLFYDGTFDADAEALERYFNNFAIAARLRHERQGE
ncbi:hypothetical protein GMI69_06195 [Eggerthellaceae bacterium zg-887]|uniref:hypothetical protein n=1 Tax=Xiamenia xianingshaonis TaxID=2682776 RepID=UPI0014089198|nr:hypothetical protein [Xiamenia xianingshaonis]NHM16247.1 hypothetical protein [Xiamenia xianingshaonis]